MENTPLTAAILVVSTTAAAEISTDTSSGKLRLLLEDSKDHAGHSRWKVASVRIVPDDVAQIQKQISQWTDGPDAPQLIVTTGGTGFAVSDSTPEVSPSPRPRTHVLLTTLI